jgi:hypothetical protein
MGIKKIYPYPSYKNPIRLSPRAKEAREQLKELAACIIANEKIFQRKNDKIPALPFWIEALHSVHYQSWCFECFEFIREALRHGIIKNRHDARFWGLGEKKALCGDCLEKKLEQMPPRKQHLWKEYKKREYWEIN